MKSQLDRQVTSEETVQIEKVPTGVEGLDYMLGGGVPSGRCVLVSGGPGAGKTIFGINFLVDGAARYGEAGLYVTLDESPTKLKRDMASFNWDLERLEKDRRLLILDACPIRSDRPPVGRQIYIQKRKFSISKLISTTETWVQKIAAKRLVIDPITMFALRFPDVYERRNAIVDLFEGISKLDITSLLTAELRANILEREIQPEEFLSDGVIVLHNFLEGGKLIRAIHIEKMRGISHDHQLRPYKIHKNGIIVFAKETVLTNT